jgi:hypothetical protein
MQILGSRLPGDKTRKRRKDNKVSLPKYRHFYLFLDLLFELLFVFFCGVGPIVTVFMPKKSHNIGYSSALSAD